MDLILISNPLMDFPNPRGYGTWLSPKSFASSLKLFMVPEKELSTQGFIISMMEGHCQLDGSYRVK